MIDVGRALVFVFFCLTVACDLLIALFIFGRLVSDLVSRCCTAGRSFRGAARVNRPDGRNKMIGEPWTARIVNVDRKARTGASSHGYTRPPQEAAIVKAQVANIGGVEARPVEEARGEVFQVAPPHLPRLPLVVRASR